MIRNGFTNLKKFQTARRPGDMWQGVRQGLSSQILPGLRTPPNNGAVRRPMGTLAGIAADRHSPGGGAPGGAPAAPAAQAPSQMPPDSLYLLGLSQNQKIHDSTVAGLTGHQGATGLDYGIDFKRGADGGLQSYGIADNVDVTNPFSKAAALKTAFQNRTRANTNSMAAQGQLYSGALQNAQDETGRQNLQGVDALLKNFAASFGEDAAGITTADNDLSGSNLSAYGDLLGRQSEKAPAGPDAGPSAADFANLGKLLARGKAAKAPARPASYDQRSQLRPPSRVTGKSRNKLTKTKAPKVIR